MTRYRVTHHTTYTYDVPVDRSVNEARLLPRATATQAVHAAQLFVDPLPSLVTERLDFFGNRTHHVALDGPLVALSISAASEVTVFPPLSPLPVTPTWEEAAAALVRVDDPEAIEARQFGFGSPMAAPHPAIDEWAAPTFPPGRPLAEAVLDLSQRIHSEFRYAPGATTHDTSPLDVLRSGQGVCQDFAHLALACLRGRGLAARYVSGYVETSTPHWQSGDASHAWVAAWVPGWGWLDVDPTNDVLVGDMHVTTAWGRDYADVPPLKGVVFWSGTDQRLGVSVTVERLPEP